MADTKISALTDGTTAAATDRIPVARSPFGAGDNRYISVSYIPTYLAGLNFTWSGTHTFSNAIEVGHASDTTLARSGAGDLTIEGNQIYRAAGTDVALADGGTGASLTDPNADRIMFWDDSAGAVTWLTPGTGLTITGTTIDAASGSGDVVGPASATDNAAVRFDSTTGKLVQDSLLVIGDTGGLSVSSGPIVASAPWSLTQTWNSGGTTFAGITVAVTDTASAAASELFNASVGGTRRFAVRKDGRIFIGSSGGYFEDASGSTISVSGVFTFGNTYFSCVNRGLSMGASLGAQDLILTRSAAAVLQLGAADALAPVSQTLRAQGSRAGTDTNAAGGNLTIMSGTGTGNAAVSSLILRSPVAVGSGSSTQTVTTGATIKNGTTILPVYTVANLPTGEAGAKCFASDANATTFHSVVAGGGANFVPVFHDGTNWRIG